MSEVHIFVTRITIFTEAIWPSIEVTLEYLLSKRQEPIPDLVRAGLNFSIVLGSACYLEGVLEALLKAILGYRRAEFNRTKIEDFESRRAMNVYYNRLEEDLSQRIGHSNGAQAYDEVLDLLAGQRLSQLKEVVPLWEGVTVLFNFRNVLGHGREVFASHFAGGAVGGGKEEFAGGYRKVEDYLRKQGLLSRRFVDAPSEYLFLSDPIADHFWGLAKALPTAILCSLPPAEQNACLKVLERATEDTNADA
ncbi:MAG: hypothetical protein ACHP7P_12445 [Terriglobales bacterium]